MAFDKARAQRRLTMLRAQLNETIRVADYFDEVLTDKNSGLDEESRKLIMRHMRNLNLAVDNLKQQLRQLEDEGGLL